MRPLTRHLSYANVTATMALFVALSGSSYAAVKLTGKDIKDGTLTGRDIRNRSLRAVDFRRGELPSGPRGLQGAKGDPGPRATFRQVVGPERQVAKATGTNGDEVTMTCPDGGTAVGGGNAAGYRYVWINLSAQAGSDGWRVRVTYYGDDVGGQDPYWRWTPAIVCAY
jgi:hypothetical protein